MSRVARLLLAIALLFCGTVMATPTPMPTEQDRYVVQKDDNLYSLEGEYSGNPQQWGRLVELNPFLNDPGRTWEKGGKTIVLIRPGEELLGLKELGIVPNPFPLDQLSVADPDTSVVIAGSTETSQGSNMLRWFILALSAIAIAFLIWRIRLRRNPVMAGPPIIPEGVTNETASAAFRNQVVRTSGTPMANVQIRNISRGRLYGHAQVGYQRGHRRNLILNGDVGYKAEVRRDGGNWSEEYMLLACGNDVRAGSRFFPGANFRFEIDEAIESEPQTVEPAPEATPPAEPQVEAENPPPSAPSQALAEPETADGDEDEEVVLDFKPATATKPALIRIPDGVTSVKITKKGGVTSIRVK